MRNLFSPALDNLHDSTLLKLNFNLEHGELEILIEEEVDGPRKVLHFKGVSKVNLGELNSFCVFELIELNYVDVKKAGDSFNIEIIFLLGISKPSWSISFDFKNWSTLSLTHPTNPSYNS
jgi:hypothetical protein